MKKSTLIIIALAVVKSSYAQYKEAPKTFGDKAFANKDYYEAAYYYRKAAEGLSLVTQQAIPYHADNTKVEKGKPEDRAYISYRLGESYRGYENYLEAEPWYYRVLNDAEKKKDTVAKKPASNAIEIDFDGIQTRMVLLPIPAGNYGNLGSVKGKILYQKYPNLGSGDDNKPALKYFDIDKREEKTILDNVDGYQLCANTNKLLAQSGDYVYKLVRNKNVNYKPKTFIFKTPDY